LYQVAKLLGHSSDTRVTRLYAALQVDDLREGVELLNRNYTHSHSSNEIINEVYKILSDRGM